MTLKFKEPHIIKATYRIVTPMFIGDAEQHATGISPASVKGALRFWWRALMWGKIRSNEKFSTDDAALRELYEQEAALFGIAMNEQRAKDRTANGQGQFTLRVELASGYKTTEKDTVHPQLKNHDAARYLGYGLMTAFGIDKGKLTRSCINEDHRFTVKLSFKGTVDSSITNALIALGLLGGLGSRVRHGFGGIALECLEIEHNKHTTKLYEQPKTSNEYIAAIHSILNNLTTISHPPFSAFSQETRIDLLEKSTTPYNVLNAFGKKMLLYRSWGKDGKVLGEESEKRFKADHDWSKGQYSRDFHPKRVIFGLPHNYGKGDHLAVTPEKHREPYPVGVYKHDRRASPLFFHVHKIGSEYVGVSLLLPATFLPQGEKINAGGTNVPAKIEWSVLTDFLDGKDKKGNVRFQHKQSIVKGVNIL